MHKMIARASITAVLGIGATSMGCAMPTRYEVVQSQNLSAAFEQVMRAEGEAMALDSRAHALRKKAREEFKRGTSAASTGDARQSAVWFAYAEADAELAVALHRRDAWTYEVQRAAARLEKERQKSEAAPTPGATPEEVRP